MTDEHQNDYETGSTADMPMRDQIAMAACKAAANIMAARGLPPEDIAHGFLAYGGAMMLEMVGAQDTAAVFQSKADGLVDALH